MDSEEFIRMSLQERREQNEQQHQHDKKVYLGLAVGGIATEAAAVSIGVYNKLNGVIAKNVARIDAAGVAELGGILLVGSIALAIVEKMRYRSANRELYPEN